MASTVTTLDLGPFEARFESEGWANSGPEWMQKLRQSSMERARALGLPTKRTPGWENTDLKPLTATRKLVAKPGHLDPAVLERAAFSDEAARLVFVDGYFSSQLSRVDGLPDASSHTLIESGTLELATPAQDPQDSLGWLNLAFLQDGAILTIPKDTVLDHPIHVVHVHTRPGSMTSTRHVVVAERGSKATVVESWVGSAPDTTTLHSTELVVRENAHLSHVKQQLEHASAIHYSEVNASVYKHGTVETFLWSDGGAWSRSSTNAFLLHEGAHCSVDGIWLGKDKQMHDCPTRIEHRAPHTTSAELWKGIMDDESHGIFLGNVIVAQDAQRVDSQQTNRNLLLSKKAKVDTTPQLEIHADDVKCAHGSTIGQLDPEALFFLRARGIDKQRAGLILTKAFAGEAIGRVNSWGIRTRLERRLENWFNRRKSA